jgi:hypothetical protein
MARRHKPRASSLCEGGERLTGTPMYLTTIHESKKDGGGRAAIVMHGRGHPAWESKEEKAVSWRSPDGAVTSGARRVTAHHSSGTTISPASHWLPSRGNSNLTLKSSLELSFVSAAAWARAMKEKRTMITKERDMRI